MAQETIQAIRNAESESAQKEKDARDQAAKIVDDARTRALELSKQRISEIRAKGNNDLKLAGAQNEEIIAKAKEAATAEIEELRNSISAKEPDAVNSVIDTLFS